MADADSSMSPGGQASGAVPLGRLKVDQAALERIIAEAGVMFIALDGDWRLAYVSEDAARELGKRPDEVLGQVVWEAFPAYVGTDHERRLREAKDSGSVVEYETYSPVAKRWRTMRVHPHEDGVHVYGRDATERRATQEQGRAYRDRHSAMIEAIPDPIAILDRDLRYTYVNEATYRWTGRHAEDYIGKTPAEIGIPDDVYAQWRSAAEDVFRTGQTGRAEVVNQTPDGTQHWDVRLAPLFDEDGAVELVLSMPRNITALRVAEETVEARARQQRAVAELGQRALEAPPLRELLDQAARLVAETLETEFSKVLELRPDNARLAFVAGYGWRDGVVGHVEEGDGPASPAGFVLATRQPLLMEDVARETRFVMPSHLHEHGVVSLVDVIIHKADRPYGVLGAHSSRARRFTEDDLSFLQAIANILATAIDRRRHEETIRQLSTPILRVRDELLLAPLIGEMDDARAQQLTDQLLQAVHRERARAVVLDLTGVVGVDQSVGQRLIATIESARLMGATTIVSGISTEASRALLHLDDRATLLRTTADLHSGIQEAERMLKGHPRQPSLSPSRTE